MKKIGFIDYYLSEWHANNYPKWIQEVCSELGLDYKVCYGYGELETSPKDGVTGKEWCEKNGIQYCSTIEEVCENSDYIVVLAPSDPEKHLQYAKKVLSYGKRTYIDKTFTPDYAQAKEIFELGEKYGADFFSTSALRYATELEAFSGLGEEKSFVITGGGSNFDEYIVHQVEMLLCLTQSTAVSAQVQSFGKTKISTVRFENGDVGNLIYSPALSFTVNGSDKNSNGLTKQVTSDFFKLLMKDIVNFFETGKKSFDGKQTLECMRIREMLIKA